MKYMEEEKITIRKAIDLFIRKINVDGMAESTVSCYSGDMEIFYSFCKDKTSIRYLTDIKYVHLIQYIEYLKREKKYRNTTASRKFNCLRTFFTEMWKIDYIDESLIKKLKKETFGLKKRDKVDNVEEFQKSVISPEVMKIILKRLEDSNDLTKYRDICIFRLLQIGQRRTDILYIKWKSVDFKEKNITIFREKTQNYDTVQIPQVLYDALKIHCKIAMADGLLSDNVINSTHFPGRGLSTTAYNTVLKKYLKGLKCVNGTEITGHSFRHTFITNAFKNNINIEIIQKFTGITIETLQTYCHMSAKDTTEVANLIDKMAI